MEPRCEETTGLFIEGLALAGLVKSFRIEKEKKYALVVVETLRGELFCARIPIEAVEKTKTLLEYYTNLYAMMKGITSER